MARQNGDGDHDHIRGSGDGSRDHAQEKASEDGRSNTSGPFGEGHARRAQTREAVLGVAWYRKNYDEEDLEEEDEEAGQIPF